MDDCTIKPHELQPYFDLEGFMALSRESRLGGGTLERLVKHWESWLALLRVREIQTGKISYLATWLPEEVETAVDELWNKSPSEGFLINNLAQFMCMAAIQEVLPQVEDNGCAPSPRPTAALRAALTEIGVPYKGPDSSLLSRRYAVVTHFPYRGGCEICHMQSHCPKGQGHAESASVLLPGYERQEAEKD